jgi:hypothetical protein
MNAKTIMYIHQEPQKINFSQKNGDRSFNLTIIGYKEILIVILYKI